MPTPYQIYQKKKEELLKSSQSPATPTPYQIYQEKKQELLRSSSIKDEVISSAPEPGLFSKVVDFFTPAQEKTTPLDILASETGKTKFQLREDIVGKGAALQEEARAIIGQGLEGVSGGIISSAPTPETTTGAFLGSATKLAGDVIGPFTIAEKFVGPLYETKVLKSLPALAQVIGKSATNLGLGMMISETVPALKKSKTGKEFLKKVGKAGLGGAKTGGIFPLFGAITPFVKISAAEIGFPALEVAGKPLEIAIGMTIMDMIRARGQKKGLLAIDDFYNDLKSGRLSAEQIGKISFSYFLEAFFIYKNPSLFKEVTRIAKEKNLSEPQVIEAVIRQQQAMDRLERAQEALPVSTLTKDALKVKKDFENLEIRTRGESAIGRKLRMEKPPSREDFLLSAKAEAEHIRRLKQELLPEPTPVITPEGQILKPEAQALLSAEGNILYDKFYEDKSAARRASNKIFKETGLKPEIRQNPIDKSFYLEKPPSREDFLLSAKAEAEHIRRLKQELLPEPTPVITPEGQILKPEAQALLSAEGNILYDKFYEDKSAARRASNKIFKETGLKPEIRQNPIDKSFYLEKPTLQIEKETNPLPSPPVSSPSLTKEDLLIPPESKKFIDKVKRKKIMNETGSISLDIFSNVNKTIEDYAVKMADKEMLLETRDKVIKETSSNREYLKYRLTGKLPEDIVLPEEYIKRLDILRNKDVVMSRTKPTREIYDRGFEIMRHILPQEQQSFLEQKNKIFEGLTPEQKVDLMFIANGDKQAKTPLMEQKSQELRTFLNDLRQYGISKGIEDFGYLDNYFPRMFIGDYWVKVGKDYKKIFQTEKEAVQYAIQQKKENPNEEINIWKSNYIPPDIATTLSSAKYNKILNTLNKLQKDKEIVIPEEILMEIASLKKDTIGKRYFGNILKRLENNPNWLKEPDQVMDMYIYGLTKKANQDNFTSFALEKIGELPAEAWQLRDYVEKHYIPSLLGKPTYLERLMGDFGVSPGRIRKYVSKLSNFQYFMDLGGSITTVTGNTTQYLMNTYPIVGEKYALIGWKKGFQTVIKDKDLLKELWDAGVFSDVSSLTGKPLLSSFKIPKNFRELLDLTLIPFQFIELYGNRISTYFAGKEWAKDILQNKPADIMKIVDLVNVGNKITSPLYEMAKEIQKGNVTNSLKEKFISETGKRLVHKTQFSYTSDNLPVLLDSSLLKVISPYKSFMQNQIKYSLERLSPKGIYKHPKEALRYALISYAIGGMAGNTISKIYFKALSPLYEFLFDRTIEEDLKKYNLDRGLLAKGGLDISGSVEIYMPQKPRQYLGRVANLALDTKELVEKMIQGRPLTTTKRKIIKRLAHTQGRRVYSAYDILKTGKIKSFITGRTIIIPKDKRIAALKSLMGLNPGNMRNLFETTQELNLRNSINNEIVADYRVRIMDAALEGNTEKVQVIVTELEDRIKKAQENLEKTDNPRKKYEYGTDIARFSGVLNDTALIFTADKRELPLWAREVMRLPKAMRDEAIYKYNRIEESN